MSKERLQKILAAAGVASRRRSEEMIEQGRVRVNGKVVRELGTRADSRRDRIEVDGKRIVREKPVYYVLHKPRAMISTVDDPEGREAVGDLTRRLPERVFPIGRLDYHTSGALLLTNDGEMAEALLRPARGVPKVYALKVRGSIDEQELRLLRNGVQLDDGTVTNPAEVFVTREDGRHSWLQMTLTEGKNRQLHRMMEAIDRRIQRLARLSFAGISTEGLRPGEMRPLSTKDLDTLKRRYLTPYRKRHKPNEVP